MAHPATRPARVAQAALSIAGHEFSERWGTRRFHDPVHLSICAESAPVSALSSPTILHPFLSLPSRRTTCHTTQHPPLPPTTNAGSSLPSHLRLVISLRWLEARSTMHRLPLPLLPSGNRSICAERSCSEGTQENTRFGMTHPPENPHLARSDPLVRLGRLEVRGSWDSLALRVKSLGLCLW